MDNNYYVYEWYIKSSDHIFHVGKGSGDRLYSLHGRNIYFKRIYDKYDVDVRIYKSGLTEQEAWEIEKHHIKELQKIGQCETNIHEGGCGGDTVTHMSKADYTKFCKKVGLKTRERCKDPIYKEKLRNSILTAMQTPEVKQKVSTQTKIAMQDEEVKQKLWENGRAHPVLLVFSNRSYILFKYVKDYRTYIKDNFNLSTGWTIRMYSEEFTISYQTKHNKNIDKLIGARAYVIDKQLFRSVTTMADECKPVEEILSLLEAHSSSNTEEIV